MGSALGIDWRRLSFARTERELAAQILSDWMPSFGAGIAGVYLWTSDEGGEIYTRGPVSHSLLDDYESLGRRDDPLLARVARYHTVGFDRIQRVRELAIGYRDFACRHVSAFEYYAIAPLVANGRLAGTIYLSLPHCARGNAVREQRDRLRALSLHASARLAQLRFRTDAASRWEGVLSPDNVILCDLATGGHTVAAIATALGVSANTVKKRLKDLYTRFGVASRAELATQFIMGPPNEAKRFTESRRCGPWVLVSQT